MTELLARLIPVALAAALSTVGARRRERASVADPAVPHLGTRERTPIVRVEPLVTVEVLADLAVDGGRWRHATRFLRTRPDL